MNPRLVFLPLLLALPPAARAGVVINEIMYHPSGDDPAGEYIELHNSGAATVDLGGWRFTDGVSLTLPAATSLAPGGYLVVTGNPAAFHVKYPAVGNYLSGTGWTGRLSNSGNRLILRDAAGTVVDEVAYADDGDWGLRERDALPDHGHRGWHWSSPADGGGKSLELINPVSDNAEGQNWKPSTPDGGTPGAANSTFAAEIAPVITRVAHDPPVPSSTGTVTITARVRDEAPSGLTVTVRFRNDGAASFDTASMFDDGGHGDGLAGDGIYGAQLPARASGTVVEYYVHASDTAGNTRDWPAMGRDYTGTLDHFCNALYQVDDTVPAGNTPVYYLVMKAADKAELSAINANTGLPPFPFNAGEANDQTLSQARFNSSFVSRDASGALTARHLSGTRNRGDASRAAQPQSLNLRFANDDPWRGVSALNLSSQYTPFQVFGSALMRQAGLVTPESRAVRLRVNGGDAAVPAGPTYGFFASNEAADTDFVDHHFPRDASGNLYRGSLGDGSLGADLRDQSAGQPAATANPAPYRANYTKETNSGADQWADLIGLTKALAKGHATAAYGLTYDADFVPAVQSAVNVKQWMTFFAANTLADNDGPTLARGTGDDYFLYFGATDPRAVLINDDLDTLFRRLAGQAAPGDPAADGLFRMAAGTAAGNPPTPLYPFMARPEFALVYFQELQRLLDGPFSPAKFNSLADSSLGSVWSASGIQALKDFNAARGAYVRSLLQLSLSGISAGTTGGTPLTVTSGYPRSTAASINLSGKADCTRTASVKVNGLAAAYAPWQVTGTAPFTTAIGAWNATGVPLFPGVNRLRIQAFDAAGVEIEQSLFDVWYDNGAAVSVPATIVADTTWTAEGGPYQVAANLTVNSGVTLTIQPGATVYLNSGIRITVNAGASILAEGTETRPIRFTRAPGTTGNGGSIILNGQSGNPESRFYHTYFEYGGDPAMQCNTNSNVVLDHCEWLRDTVSYLHLDGASFLVSNCIFPASAPGAYFEGVHGNGTPPAGGRAIIRDSFFGKIGSISSDYNDVVDFTGGNRPGTIIQFYNNVFTGSDDDCLDLDGTDAWVEGNIFMHIHRVGSPDSSSAISGGNDGGGGTGSRKSATAINVTTDQITCGTHGFTTGQEVEATALLGNTFPAATPTLHDGGPYFVRAISTTVVKLYLTTADATADTNAIDFTGTIGTGVSLSLTKLDAISHITMVGNLFYDLDQVATAKEGNFYTFLNNTVIDQSNTGSEDEETGVLNFGDDSYHEAGGMYAEGNVIQSAHALVRNYPGAGLQQTVTWNNNLFPPGMTWTGAGTGNVSADALLNDTAIPTPGPRDYQRVAAEIRRRFGLQSGSPARGTGPNGADKGAIRPLGVSIGGAPAGTTNATGAVLTVGTRMTGGGISSGTGAWQNGSGWTHYKWRLDGGTWSPETVISTPISLTGLANGTHTVEVSGKNDAGTYQDSPDLGPSARPASVTWTVDTAYVPPAAAQVRLNEVLARNTATAGFGGVFPGLIELYNAGTAPAVLDGWGLSNDPALPWQFTFPSGTSLAPGAYLTVYTGSAAAVPSPKTGFTLSGAGDVLTLTRPASQGGTAADTVMFGPQLPDLSIGRRPADGVWDLSRPSFGSANTAIALGALSGVKINEWLADARWLATGDFVELFNPGSLPVNLGGAFLTDTPQGWPDRSAIRPLSFIGANSYLVFLADGNPAAGPGHLDFKLAPEQGAIGLFDSTLAAVDTIVYGPRSADVSQGRTPNGGETFGTFTQPTPGGPNPQVSTVVGISQSVNLILPNQTWRYLQSSTDPFPGSTAWKDSGFNDAAWSSAAGSFYIENSAFPTNTDGFAKTTALTGYNSTHPYQTYYFRTHFNYTGPLTGVTLTARMLADDAPILYLNGQEIRPVSGSRIRLGNGADTYALQATGTSPDVTIETYTFNATGLVNGDNVLAVSLHQSDTQSATAGSSDATWGLKLSANYSIPAPNADAVVINEVLAVNTALQNPDGALSGWLELYNTGTAAADLTDVSLTTDTGAPRAFVFPSGTTLAAGGYLAVYCNGSLPATATVPFNTGFALSPGGGGVYLFKSRATGGGLLDSVNHGNQIADYSIGRVPNGTGVFVLSTVSRGATNAAATTVPATSVKINEWQTAAEPAWVELYNTSTSPAALGGSALTDDFLDRTKSPLPPLSFLAGTGSGRWLQLFADNAGSALPGHLTFTLQAGEGIALYAASGALADSVVTAAIPPGATEGRLPDGTATIASLAPTPGSANAGSSVPPDSDGDGLPDVWENAYGLDSGNAADALLDSDGDGIPNLLEYAFNMNPRLPDANPAAGSISAMPSVKLVPVAGGSVLEITFVRRRPATAPRLNYTVLFSSDMINWSPTGGEVVTPLDAQMEKVTVQDALQNAGSRRFGRVRVSVTP